MTTTEYPIDKLSEPQASDYIHDYVELIISGNGPSLTYHLNNAICMATAPFMGGEGFNCISTITNNFSGDWAALRKAADAIHNLSEYNNAYHAAIDSAMGKVEQSWQGNAAESARSYFESFTAALDGQAAFMAKIADDISSYALASYGMANGVADLVQWLGDMAIQWLVTFLAAKAAASTGVGVAVWATLEVAAAAIAAAMALKAVKIIGNIGHVVNASEALAGLMSSGVIAAVEGSQIPMLPGKAYDHPGVSA